jgi:hypothetical protein
LTVVEQTPDAGAAGSALQVAWPSAGATGSAPQAVVSVTRLIGPVLVGLPVPVPASAAPAPSEGAPVVVPAIRITMSEGASPQRAVSVPFNLLAVLGTSPAGTPLITNGTARQGPPPRVILQLPDAATTDGLLRLLVFTPLLFTGGDESEPAPEESGGVLTPAPEGETRGPLSTQPEAWPLDSWFSRLGWLDWDAPGRQAQRPREPRPALSGRPAGDEGEALEQVWETAGRDEPADPEECPWSLALCAAAVGVSGRAWQGEDDRDPTRPGKWPRKAWQ